LCKEKNYVASIGNFWYHLKFITSLIALCRKDVRKNSRVPPLMLNPTSHLGRSTSVQNATNGHFIEQFPKPVGHCGVNGAFLLLLKSKSGPLVLLLLI